VKVIQVSVEGMTEKYVHMAALIDVAADTVFPQAAARSERLVFSALNGSGIKSGTNAAADESPLEAESPSMQGVQKLPGLDSNQQPSG
jgi:hypothetical protein